MCISTLDLLSELDLVHVYEDVFEVCIKWYDVGLKLGLTPTLLEKIRANNQRLEERLREMLWQWLQQKVGNYTSVGSYCIIHA